MLSLSGGDAEVPPGNGVCWSMPRSTFPCVQVAEALGRADCGLPHVTEWEWLRRKQARISGWVLRVGLHPPPQGKCSSVA
eukprot:4402807-Amphidinium_carterae.1